MKNEFRQKTDNIFLVGIFYEDIVLIIVIDIDECLNPYVVCGVDSECQNSEGSYRCICKPGFKPNHGKARTGRPKREV